MSEERKRLQTLREAIKSLKELCDQIAPVPRVSGWAAGSHFEDQLLNEYDRQMRINCYPGKVSPVLQQAAHVAFLMGFVPDFQSECAWCDFRFDRPEDPEAERRIIANHITKCEGHPVMKAAQLVADEREACAKLVDEWPNPFSLRDGYPELFAVEIDRIAERIRERGGS